MAAPLRRDVMDREMQRDGQQDKPVTPPGEVAASPGLQEVRAAIQAVRERYAKMSPGEIVAGASRANRWLQTLGLAGRTGHAGSEDATPRP